jgi:hypothetical protein
MGHTGPQPDVPLFLFALSTRRPRFLKFLLGDELFAVPDGDRMVNVAAFPDGDDLVVEEIRVALFRLAAYKQAGSDRANRFEGKDRRLSDTSVIWASSCIGGSTPTLPVSQTRRRGNQRPAPAAFWFSQVTAEMNSSSLNLNCS